MHIAVIWQRFLPYHAARIRRLRERLAGTGHKLTAIEVASRDASYGFDVARPDRIDRLCCFPGVSYHDLKARDIRSGVLSVLEELKPDVVFAPATPFPEGMAAVSYRMRSGTLAIMMDDAWEHTDRRGSVTRQIKCLIHRNLDGAFIPAPSHLPYYTALGFPEDRIFFGVDVVDNDYFAEMSMRARLKAPELREVLGVPADYFLFVGRILPRKGLDTLLAAYMVYRSKSVKEPWGLTMVGAGSGIEDVRRKAGGMEGVVFAGARFGDSLCRYYALAGCLVIPSLSDPWGLVVNEGMASGLPVIVSRGCGSAKTLVHDGENGWTFEPRDEEALAGLMIKISGLPAQERMKMGKESQVIITDWSLERFARGVLQAIEVPRRPSCGLMENMAARLWNGRVRIN